MASNSDNKNNLTAVVESWGYFTGLTFLLRGVSVSGLCGYIGEPFAEYPAGDSAKK